MNWFICGLIVSSAILSLNSQASVIDIDSSMRKLEHDLQADIGVYYESKGQSYSYNSSKRFPFCSSFKFLVSAATLKNETDKSLQEIVKYTSKDIAGYSPYTKKNIKKGMSVIELVEAVHFSDSTATNLLLKRLGGLNEMNYFAKSMGDNKFIISDFETKLNVTKRGQVNNTTTPKSISSALKNILEGNFLSVPRKTLFKKFMIKNDSGLSRIRSAIGKDEVAGDKTGTCNSYTLNDVAFIENKKNEYSFVSIFIYGKHKRRKIGEKYISYIAKLLLDDAGSR